MQRMAAATQVRETGLGLGFGRERVEYRLVPKRRRRTPPCTALRRRKGDQGEALEALFGDGLKPATCLPVQCQSQLQTLYAEGIKGCHMEFAAYNLLCVILHSNNHRDLLSAMSRLSADAKKDKAVKHALSVRTAVTAGNYVMFFRLYKTAPNLNTFLMDLYVEKMRYAAVKCMSRSYRPTVPVSYLAQILGFTSASPKSEAIDEKEMDGVEECMEWLKAHGACVTTDNSGEMLLDTKASVPSLYMPEPEDAVSHGDASLAVNDFLTRSLA
ncbi:hypothetical protein RD792_013539 [Penstemon davidsonii]|uniref:PCI domain-containing protein n=1 Tax=Penstemon davidsonii TaxID=160366 RepID=A0ABR0CTS5_9LAMI|nr:hypothetical protein RD792_013539 [Penstemon davidsonii]